MTSYIESIGGPSKIRVLVLEGSLCMGFKGITIISWGRGCRICSVESDLSSPMIWGLTWVEGAFVRSFLWCIRPSWRSIDVQLFKELRP